MTFHCSQSKDLICNINDNRPLHQLAHLPLQPNFVLFSSFFSVFQSQGTTFSSSKVPCSLQPWGPHTCCFFFSLHLPPLPNKPLKSLLVSVQTSAPQRSLPRLDAVSHLYVLIVLCISSHCIQIVLFEGRNHACSAHCDISSPQTVEKLFNKICFERKGGRERFK